MHKFIKHIGLDSHKDTIAVAMDNAKGGKTSFYGTIGNAKSEIDDLSSGGLMYSI